MPLRVFISSGEGLEGYRREYGDILRQSFKEWETASKGSISFQYVNSAQKADISCKWIDDPHELASSAEGGEAEVDSLLNGIVKVHILLLITDPSSAFPLTDNLVRALCLHEIGHGLGLIGHSADAHDVMFCSTPIVDREKHLSARDVNTINTLYREDVDMPSQLIAQLEYYTNGKSGQALQCVLIFVSLLVVCGALLGVVFKNSAKKKKKKSLQKDGPKQNRGH
jgi:hypothetical protein